MDLKIKLTHISAYLPYCLKCHAMGEFIDGTVYDENPIPKVFIVTGYFSDSNNDKYVEAVFDDEKHEIFFETDFFPILRPLSQLNQLIEIDSDKFIPVEKLTEMYGQTLELNESQQLVQPITCEPYILIRQLFEWHFDVFRLINNGLAVSY